MGTRLFKSFAGLVVAGLFLVLISTPATGSNLTIMEITEIAETEDVTKVPTFVVEVNPTSMEVAVNTVTSTVESTEAPTLEPVFTATPTLEPVFTAKEVCIASTDVGTMLRQEWSRYGDILVGTSYEVGQPPICSDLAGNVYYLKGLAGGCDAEVEDCGYVFVISGSTSEVTLTEDDGTEHTIGEEIQTGWVQSQFGDSYLGIDTTSVATSTTVYFLYRHIASEDHQCNEITSDFYVYAIPVSVMEQVTHKVELLTVRCLFD